MSLTKKILIGMALGLAFGVLFKLLIWSQTPLSAVT